MAVCKKLGEEWTFSQLVNCDEPTAIRERIASINPVRAIEFGCGNAICLFNLYYMFGLESVEGVDRDPEQVLVERLMQELEDKSLGPFDDRFDAFHSKLTFGPHDRIQSPLPKEQYPKHIHLVQALAEEYEPLYDKYSIMIMGDILHYMDRAGWQHMLGPVLNQLESDGILYLRFKEYPKCRYALGCDYKQLLAFCDDHLDARFHRRFEPSLNEGQACVITNL